MCKIYNSIGECDPIKARHYIQHMDDCDLCHLDDDACKSKLLYLRRLAPHFPNVRQLVNMIYNVKRTDTQVSRIDQALQTGNVDVLREISAEQNCAYQSSNEGRTSSIDENNVLKTFMKAYVSYKKRCSEFAEFPCMSCNKCDWACENRAYLHKLHMFRKRYISWSLSMISNFCSLYIIPYEFVNKSKKFHSDSNTKYKVASA